MFEILKTVAEKSYSPYSGFKVAAVLEMKDGKYISGTNIENSSFPSSMCAERVAISVAHMQNIDFNEIVSVHIYSPDANFILAPCGGCRQVMTEHLNLDTYIIMYSNEGQYIAKTLDEMIPFSFVARNFLGKK
ncbi:MAG: cytidine deaminase [Metamycoplasmataceae bacterium]